MKRRQKAFVALGLLVFVLAVWSVGFVMGNTAASKRNNRTNLFKHVTLLKTLEKGETERARQNCLTFVVGEYRFLQSDPYWLSALSDQIHVDSEEYFNRIAEEAQAISEKSLKNSKPLDEALKEEFGQDVNIETTIK
ncbi:MAG: hypothetical protein NWR51_07100 [Akkermansiaceae bacterium]|jgi:hypothetical protein|nr:hypothetical protein [Akkermansiaceae bacterium]MDP4778787.1 hypothetical protein [Akkermansiaceae bacterium]MDP4847011.1 hypothetical protein [Akkermansiaceae bacterium]MDP4896404.1 hypothetical protein [Akkermansiaceae bacterium]MDP4996985.1 hypothetical protein [Akkermansiaceae bacterium]